MDLWLHYPCHLACPLSLPAQCLVKDTKAQGSCLSKLCIELGQGDEHVEIHEVGQALADSRAVRGAKLLLHLHGKLQTKRHQMSSFCPLGPELWALFVVLNHFLCEILQLTGGLKDLVVTFNLSPEMPYRLMFILSWAQVLEVLPEDIAKCVLGDTQITTMQDVNADHQQREPWAPEEMR